jgi:hypothetical protein
MKQGGNDLPWPVGPVEAFLLASTPGSRGPGGVSSIAGPPEFTPDQRANLCAALQASEPITRQNAEVGLARHVPSHEPGAYPACQAMTGRQRAPMAIPADGPSAPSEVPSRPGSFHALKLRDGRVLISVADGSGAVSWPDLPHIVTENPWHRPYGTE